MIVNIENHDQFYSQITRQLESGRVVAIPTDTVYGLAVDGVNESAVKALSDLKGRDRKPFTFFITKSRIPEYVKIVKRQILEYFVPGPITLLFSKQSGVALPLVAEKIGVRIPQVDFIINLLARYEHPLIVTSANLAGEKPKETAQEIAIEFKNIELIIDGGQLVSHPSTVLDMTRTPPLIKRKGVIPFLQIEKVYGRPIKLEKSLKINILFVCSGNTCRSPMAEAILRTMVDPDHCDIKSAGTLPTRGMPAAIHAQKVVENFDGSLAQHHSQSINEELITWADIIFTMGYSHYNAIVEKDLTAAVKTFLLKEYKRKVKYNEIADPVGGNKGAYEKAVQDMMPSLKLIARDIKRRFSA